ncbi:MAG: septum formation initiator family protein [Bacteroidetes bacterium]|nr:septum formation initiator family protein [Bacteroidota bacterium]MBU1116223.1 septum formation initiator family protein [Bacteroidota bacterium]MBU1799731.1 septum formation initiator family protein [Bacteroidota bacterium]
MNKEKYLKIVYLVFALIILVFLFINDNGVLKYFSLKKEINELEEKIGSTKIEIEKLNSEIDSLQNSDVKIEQVARNKYQMKHEDEIPVKINKQ